MRPQAETDVVAQLVDAGLSDYKIARTTGVPRSTVQKWRHDESRIRRRVDDIADWQPPAASTYCYLLGLYLGDGYIEYRRTRPCWLRLYLDDAYPSVIAEATHALDETFAPSCTKPYRWGRAKRTVLHIFHPALLLAFPQYGPGRKHERTIELTEWQRELTHAHPGALVRGLIHSDGCRSVNRFKTRLPSGRVKEYAYPRYFFSNLSADIRAIFVVHCELLGVRCTLSNPRNVSVSHGPSVAILEQIVGPK